MNSSAPFLDDTSLAVDGDRQRKRKLKDRKKLRSAWISFVGRIVAQGIGALATVALGFLLADRIRTPMTAPAATAARTANLPKAATAGQASIAVLPFSNFSQDAGQEFLVDGMTEALITDLARRPSLRVTSRTSIMHYKEHSKPVPEIARELGVAYVLEGSVAQVNGRIRVTAQLIEAGSDQHLWTETYDRRTGDVLALQDDVSKRIAAEVHTVLTAAGLSSVPPRRLASSGGGRLHR